MDKKIEEAAKLLASGADVRAGDRPSKRGRPSQVFIVGSHTLTRREMGLARDRAAELAVESLPKVMAPEDFVTFARSATPMLVHRAVCLAMQSEDARVVLAVAKEISERGYGKVAQSVEVSVGPDVRGAWKQLAEYTAPVIDGQFIREESIESDGGSIE